jgi:hypothetical protein
MCLPTAIGLADGTPDEIRALPVRGVSVALARADRVGVATTLGAGASFKLKQGFRCSPQESETRAGCVVRNVVEARAFARERNKEAACALETGAGFDELACAAAVAPDRAVSHTMTMTRRTQSKVEVRASAREQNRQSGVRARCMLSLRTNTATNASGLPSASAKGCDLAQRAWFFRHADARASTPVQIMRGCSPCS